MKILKYFLILMVASFVSKTINAADDYKPVQPAYSDYDGMKLGFAFPDRQSINIQKVFIVFNIIIKILIKIMQFFTIPYFKFFRKNSQPAQEMKSHQKPFPC